MKRLIPVLLLFFFLACSERIPQGIVSKEKMVAVLTDIHLVDGYANSILTDSAQVKTPVLYQSVYKKYQTDSVQFKKSMSYYARHPEMLQEIYAQVTKKLEKLQKTEQKRLEEKAKKGKKSGKDTSINKNPKNPIQDSTKTDSTKQKELQEALKRRKIMIEKIRQKRQEK